MTRVLVAPDKFKGSLSAREVAAALVRGMHQVSPGLDARCLPVADGGDGTVDAAVAAGFELVGITASGPTGRTTASAFARLGTAAVIEMATVCGLSRLPGGIPAPMDASSRGLGEAIAAALHAGCRDLVIGIGGSASTDGGAGAVAALGGRLLNSHGEAVRDGGGQLAEITRLDLTGLLPALRESRLVVACDVDNPLTGPLGAAHVFGPQKGAEPAELPRLDAALGHWADIVEEAVHAAHRNRPGAGAAGGVGFAALAVLDATMRPGIEVMLELLDFEALVPSHDVVITGEGSLDAQSMHGKAPIGVARLAQRYGVPVIAVCGRRAVDEGELREAGIGATYALLDLERDAETCMREATTLLEQVGAQICRDRLEG